MTLEQAKSKIERLGWTVIAVRKSAEGVAYDATNYKRLAKGGFFVSADEAMTDCLRVAQSYAGTNPA